jgi:ATP-dependent DNA ligase
VLRTAITLGGKTLVFIALDLMSLDGKDLRAQPIDERRAALCRLPPATEITHSIQ